MLHLLDESLAAFLRRIVPLPESEVDLSFDAPDRDWAAGRGNRPTVNLYLWDIRRNVELRHGGFESVRDADGVRARRTPLPQVDCRYLITAWTEGVRDEHSLLGDTLAALLIHDEIGAEHLADGLAQVRPWPTLQIANLEGRDNADFWSALGGQLKPGLDLVVTATLDATRLVRVRPDVQRYTVGVGRRDGAREQRSFVAGRAPTAGAVVTTPRGSARAADDGAFLVPGQPGDEVSVDGAVRGTVPDKGAVELSDPPADP